MPHAGWFAEDMRLSFDHTYDAVALAGMLTSATIVIARSPLIYLMTAQWGFYLSMYLVGQTFLSFQWDILLSVYSRSLSLNDPLLHHPTHTAHEYLHHPAIARSFRLLICATTLLVFHVTTSQRHHAPTPATYGTQC